MFMYFIEFLYWNNIPYLLLNIFINHIFNFNIKDQMVIDLYLLITHNCFKF